MNLCVSYLSNSEGRITAHLLHGTILLADKVLDILFDPVCILGCNVESGEALEGTMALVVESNEASLQPYWLVCFLLPSHPCPFDVLCSEQWLP